MPKPIRTRSVSRAQVFSYLAKAQEYAAAAESELKAGRTIAATSLAIHAGINAADAVCGARVGKRSAGQNHDDVLGLLGDAGKDGANVQKELRRLLPLKSKTEYSPDDVATSVASKAVERARRAVDIANRVVARIDY